MWNKAEGRKISGNAAPMEKNVSEYLRRHPECEVYNGQRCTVDGTNGGAAVVSEPRIIIWNRTERRKISGNASPLKKNIVEYLKRHPDWEVYNGQVKLEFLLHLVPPSHRKQDHHSDDHCFNTPDALPPVL